MIAFLSAGITLGLYAGFSPGPLIALVISQAIKHGPKEGVKIAVAPLMTDFPILLVSTFLLNRFSNYTVTIGAPTVIRGFAEGYAAPLLFVGGFLGCLVGSKCLLAVMAGRAKHFLTGKAYVYIMRTLGIALLAFAFFLFRDGLHLLR